jgi:hypothetical protein
MLHTYDKKNLVMMEDWANHAREHSLTLEQFRDAVLNKTLHAR